MASGKKFLTDKKVAALKTEKVQEDFADGKVPGLSLRVSKTGRKTWNYSFLSPTKGKNARIVLGTYPAQSLDDARDLALAKKKFVERGGDPRDEIANPHKTVEDLIDHRLNKEVRVIDEETGEVLKALKRSHKEIERRYDSYIKPLVGKVKVAKFRTTDLDKVVEPLLKRGVDRTAGMVFADLQTLFNFATRHDEYALSHNPIAKALPVGSVGEEGDRALSLDEIRHMWHRLPHVLAQSDHVPQIIKLLLITGQRSDEMCGICKSEINPKVKTWLIPEGRTKNGFEHLVPLTDMAWEIIEHAWEETKGDFLFPARDGEGFDRGAVGRAIDRVTKPSKEHPLGRLAMAKWTPHDLRRTFSTQAGALENGLDIPELYIDFAMNHRSATKRTIRQKRYDANEHLADKKVALEKWATFLKKVISSEMLSPEQISPQPPAFAG